MNPRQTRLLNHLSQHGQASVPELAALAGVSTVTVRQDLSILENEGFIRRTHGGATLLESENIAQRLSLRFEEKSRIAKRAALLVEDGETVLLESGSANALLARELAGRRVQLVVTNLFIARQIRHGDLARVIVVGGAYQTDSESVVGSMAKADINATFFSKAFIGMDGFTPETGFTNRDLERAALAAHIVEHGKQAYILADASKFGATSTARICGLEELAGVVTDLSLPRKFVNIIQASPAELFQA